MIKNLYFVYSSVKKAGKDFLFLEIMNMVASTAKAFVLLMLPKILLDRLVDDSTSESIVMVLVALLLLLIVLEFSVTFTENIRTAYLIKVTNYFSRKIVKKNINVDYPNTENPQYLNKIQSANRALTTLDKGVQGILMNSKIAISSMMLILGYSYILSKMNMWLFLFIIVHSIVLYFYTLIGKKYEYQVRDQVSDTERRVGYIYNTMTDFSYGKTIRLYGLYGLLKGVYRRAMNQGIGISKRISHHYLIGNYLDAAFVFIRDCIVFIYIMGLFKDQLITIGDVSVYIGAVIGFGAAIQKLIEQAVNIRSNNHYLMDLREIIEWEDHKDSLGTNESLTAGELHKIQFKNVWFKYPGKEDYVLKNLNLTIEGKEKLALVGENGAGKSTLIKLICRLYDVTEGSIELNGIDIRQYDKKAYRKYLSTVFQELSIFAFSIYENIALTEDLGKEQEVEDCLRKSDMYEKVMEHPKGLNLSMKRTLDQEGIEFSGGENQKIAFARALYKDAPHILLDEPNSALDPIAERKMYEMFNSHLNEKMCIYISHRIASTRFCNKIAVLKEGEIIEYGNWEELMDNRGDYYSLYEAQAQFYR